MSLQHLSRKRNALVILYAIVLILANLFYRQVYNLPPLISPMKDAPLVYSLLDRPLNLLLFFFYLLYAGFAFALANALGRFRMFGGIPGLLAVVSFPLIPGPSTADMMKFVAGVAVLATAIFSYDDGLWCALGMEPARSREGGIPLARTWSTFLVGPPRLFFGILGGALVFVGVIAINYALGEYLGSPMDPRWLYVRPSTPAELLVVILPALAAEDMVYMTVKRFNYTRGVLACTAAAYLGAALLTYLVTSRPFLSVTVGVLAAYPVARACYERMKRPIRVARALQEHGIEDIGRELLGKE